MRALSVEGRPASRPVRADGLHRWLLSAGRGAGTGAGRGQPSAHALLFKQLLPVFAQDEALRERWLQLVERNTELAHPGCSNILDFGSADGGVYVVSRYDAGLPLSALMQTMREVGEPMAHELVAHIANELLGALAYVQTRDAGLVHLDLDPAGLLVQADGSLVMPEFGLWSVLSPAELSRCRFDAGRVHYSSPEVVRSRPSDPRCDIFSVGVLLYELLCGERPFVGKTQLVVAMAIAEGTRRPLRDVAPRAPESLCDIVEMMLATEASHRFQSAAAAQQALFATSMVHADSASIRQRALAALHAAVPNAAWSAEVPEADVGDGAESHGSASLSLEPSSPIDANLAGVRRPEAKGVPALAGWRASESAVVLPDPARPSHLVGEPMPPPLLLASGLPMTPAPDLGAAHAPATPLSGSGGASTRDFAASSDLAVNDGRTEHLRPAPESAQLWAAHEPLRPQAGPERLRERKAPEPSLPPPVLELLQQRAPAEPSLPRRAPELFHARAPAAPQARAETADAPKAPEYAARPGAALSAVRGSEGVAFRLPKPAFRGRDEAGPASVHAVSSGPIKSHSFSSQRAKDEPNSAWSPPRAAAKWQDPSATLFQLKRPSKAARPGRKRAQPPVLAVAVLSALFGFSAVAGLYLVFRLCQ